MPGNTAPIFSRIGHIGRAAVLTTAANDYSGVSIHNREVFIADATNGSFIQKLRFKARGTNVATVARVYINGGKPNWNWASAPNAPTGTPSTSGGTMYAGTWFAVIVAYNAAGAQSVLGTFSSSVATTGTTGSIAWAWTAVPGATTYDIWVSTLSGYGARKVTVGTNSYSQIAPIESAIGAIIDDCNTSNQVFYGEISLPATTASATVATPDIDYAMGIALPAGYAITVGLGTTVASGWQANVAGGHY